MRRTEFHDVRKSPGLRVTFLKNSPGTPKGEMVREGARNGDRRGSVGNNRKFESQNVTQIPPILSEIDFPTTMPVPPELEGPHSPT